MIGANTSNQKLSSNDSLIQEMVDFISLSSASPKRKKMIEKTIKRFPDRIVQRDTVTFFVQTAYAVAFYEFCKKDYEKANHYARCFENKAILPGWFNLFTQYSSVAGSARYWGKVKEKKDKNSWFAPLVTIQTNSFLYEPRNYILFLDGFIDDIPINSHISTFQKVLSAYKNGGGKLENLNGYLKKPGIYQRLVDNNRQDVLSIIYNLWNVSENDFELDTKSGHFYYNHNNLKEVAKSDNKVSIKGLILDVEEGIALVDSLIAIGENAGTSIISLLDLCYSQNKFLDLINNCVKYEDYVSGENACKFYNLWGLGISSLGNYEDALNKYDKGISLSTSPEIRSTIRLNKGYILGEMGQTDKAVKLFMEERNNQHSSYDKFIWFDNLGYIYSFVEPMKALMYYELAERFLDTSTFDDERKIRHFCRKSRVLYPNMFRQREAIERALEFTNREYKSKNGVGMAYTELGSFNHSIFNYSESEKNFAQARNAFDSLSPEDKRLAHLNIVQADNLCCLDRPEELLPVLTHQLNVQDSLFGSNSMESLKTLRAIIMSKSKAGHVDKLQELYNRYIQLYPKYQKVVSAYDDIMLRANYLITIDDKLQAISILSNTDKKSLTPSQRIAIILFIEQLAREQSNNLDYLKITHELIDPIKYDIVNSLLTLTSNEMNSIQSQLQILVSGLIDGGNEADALSLTIFRKGLLYFTKKAIEKELGSGSSTRKDYKKLKSLRNQYNEAVAFGDTLMSSSIIWDLRKLERKLNNSLSSNKRLLKLIDRNLIKIQHRLKVNTLAIDIISLVRNNEPIYGAYVITNSQTKYIEIGSANEIELNPNLIWEKLSNYMNGYEDIYFCPDGELNGVAIEYAIGPDGNPVNQKYRLHRVFHLGEIAEPSYIGNHIVAIGVSDHNSPIGLGDKVERGSWTNLNEVESEIANLNVTLCEKHPIILFNDDATESNVKQHLGGDVTSLHISTHGVYRNQSYLYNSALDSKDEDHNIARRILSAGKTSLSGLILRQGNLSWKAVEPADGEDDILTSEEVEMLSMPNLRLTVLSACDSGLGHIDSEGVWGLQRAFRIAGSKNLICSLRKIDDYWTSQFMDVFYTHAAQGNTIYDSFHHAQKTLYEADPDSPEIWSSFILIE